MYAGNVGQSYTIKIQWLLVVRGLVVHAARVLVGPVLDKPNNH